MDILQIIQEYQETSKEEVLFNLLPIYNLVREKKIRKQRFKQCIYFIIEHYQYIDICNPINFIDLIDGYFGY